MKTQRHVLNLPIYDCRIQLIISADIHKERKKQENLFGPIDHGPIYNALCSWSMGHNFALFFEPSGLTHRIVAHEIFHLTHRICQWVGTPFTPDNHETFALLSGHLHAWLYSLVGKQIGSDSKERKLRKSR